MKTIFKILFAILGAVSVAAIGYFIYQQTEAPKTPGKIFSIKFEGDMEDLHQNGYLPSMWDNLKEVKFVSTSPNTEKWLQEAKPLISTQASGKYLLEYVLIDDSEEDKKLTIALVQMSISEVESGNKVWELARFYSLDDNESESAD